MGMGAPPGFRSSAVMPQVPGARFFFSFCIAAEISLLPSIGGVDSIERSVLALAASAIMRTGSSGGWAGLLNCYWKWSFHRWS